MLNAKMHVTYDYASTEYELKIKEGMHIQWLTPKIDKQMKSYKMTLSV